MEAPGEVVDELYGAPFDEFIKRRDARARELRKEKRREEADAVKALRKPALAAWAIDQLARQDREAVDGLLAAGAALRQAKGGDTLRDATHEERETVERLAERAEEILREAGHTVTDKTRSEIRDTLHAAALDDEARDLIDRGRLVEPRQAIGVFGTAGAVPSSAPKAESKPKAKTTKDDRAAERKRKAEARESLRDAEAELRERRRELNDAERALGEAQRGVDRARDAVEEAEETVEERRAALEE